MKYQIEPFKGVEKVLFGTVRTAIRDSLNSRYKNFTRNEFSVNSSDYYDELGFFVEYDEHDLCEAIEFTNNSSLYFQDEDLFGMKYSELRKKCDELSTNIEEEDGTGVTYHDLGFSVSKSEGDEIETILVFSQKYWL